MTYFQKAVMLCCANKKMYDLELIYKLCHDPWTNDKIKDIAENIIHIADCDIINWMILRNITIPARYIVVACELKKYDVASLLIEKIDFQYKPIRTAEMILCSIENTLEITEKIFAKFQSQAATIAEDVLPIIIREDIYNSQENSITFSEWYENKFHTQIKINLKRLITL